MKEEDKKKTFKLKCKSKRGEQLTKKEAKYLQKMFAEYPNEYSDMESEVFQETKPFGSV